MSIEKFTYKQLLDPPVATLDHFSFRLIPTELRTPAYDLRLLNGGANKSQPYSVEAHLQTDRWKYGQAVQERILTGGVRARILLSEAALRNFGGGDDSEIDRRVQQEAIFHIADCALKSCDVRVLPLSGDSRGAATDDFMVANFSDEATKVVTWNLLGGTMHDDPRLATRTAINFEEMWQGALPEQASLTYLEQIASDI